MPPEWWEQKNNKQLPKQKSNKKNKGKYFENEKKNLLALWESGGIERRCVSDQVETTLRDGDL